MEIKSVVVPDGESLQEIGRLLDDNIIPIEIDVINWKKFNYKPQVSVQIAHNGHFILLKYDVREQAVMAKVTKPNGEVWTDSCVEFFISPGGDNEYYNFEFNCIGTPLLRHNINGEVVFASDDVMSSIKTLSTLGNKPFDEKKGDWEWSLVVAIPVKSLFRHDISELQGRTMKANFYKCGDGLTVPHFVAWTRIETENPSFHEPRFFGEIVFE